MVKSISSRDTSERGSNINYVSYLTSLGLLVFIGETDFLIAFHNSIRTIVKLNEIRRKVQLAKYMAHSKGT